MTRRPYTPHDYQQVATEHLLNTPRCALWADMGMGKSVSTLTALDTLFLSGTETQPALIIAPKRVAESTWPREAEKWAHLREIEVSVVIGTQAERKAALARDASVYTINYDNLTWLADTLADSWPFGTVVSDESPRLKSMRPSMQKSSLGKEFVRVTGGKRARQLARVAHSKVHRFIELTGSPASNGLADLWGQMWFIDAGQRLGRTYEGFMQRWFRPKYDGYGVEPLPFAQEQIHDRLRDVCLSLRAADYFDIQQPRVSPVYVDLPGKARALYRDMEREMFMEIEQYGVEALNAASRSMKCLQLAAGAVYVDDKKTWKEVHDGKLQALESIACEASGAPLLVSYQWKHDAERILKAFPKARVLDSKATEDEWNAGKISMLVAHPKSCGHGLNLQDGGHNLAYFSDWWDLELHDQILERIGPVRQMQAGYNRVVNVYPIIARDTLDELVLARHETKRAVQDLLMDAMKARKARL